MNISQGVFLIQEAFRTMNRHKGVAVVSITIMSLSLLILAVFLLVTDNMFVFMEKTKDEMRVYVYLDDYLTDNEINALYADIMLKKEVEQLVFISKEEALSDFKREMGGDSPLLEAMEVNPLPASFRAVLKREFTDKEAMESFAQSIGSMKGVEEVKYGKEFIDQFSTVTRGFLYADALIGFIVVLSSIFIIANTVRLAVVSRRKTIEILKLVGATNRFITTPFLIEGAFQGTIASVVSLVLLFVIYVSVKNMVPDLAFFPPEKALLYIGVCLGFGTAGSYAALRRYLKV